jgi:serine kinase of HPr protein (carbohydrate metabolism regulator)
MNAPGRPSSIHASAVVIGEAGVLIRGASGAGKSALALALVEAARASGLFARLVADDRVVLACAHGRLIARPHPALAGLVERRGEGVGPARHENAAVLRVVVDLAPGKGGDPGAPRLPEEADTRAEIAGTQLARLVLPAGASPMDAASRALDFIRAGFR